MPVLYIALVRLILGLAKWPERPQSFFTTLFIEYRNSQPTYLLSAARHPDGATLAGIAGEIMLKWARIVVEVGIDLAKTKLQRHPAVFGRFPQSAARSGRYKVR